MEDVEQRRVVEAQDVESAVAAAINALKLDPLADWSKPAGDLEWTCRATLEHVADDLVAYGALLTDRAHDSYPPFEVILAPAADHVGMLRVLNATGGLLAAAVRATPAYARVWHPYGMADPEAVAAMGVVEVLVHTHDICRGLSLPWQPSADLSSRVLRRLFHSVSADGDSWAKLLWATGRTELPGQPRLQNWRWHNEPPSI